MISSVVKYIVNTSYVPAIVLDAGGLRVNLIHDLISRGKLCGGRVYGNSLYSLCNFSVNLKLLLKSLLKNDEHLSKGCGYQVEWTLILRQCEQQNNDFDEL